MRTFGTAKLVKGSWLLDVEPHVALRVRRMFRKVKQQKGKLYFAATEESSRDLEWFASRYPLRFDDEETLTRLARAFDQRAEEVVRILDGRAALPEVEMHLPPREYQRQAAALLLHAGSLLLADEVGLGKTVTAITAIADRKLLPALVVVQPHLQSQWKREIERFLPFYYVHVVKQGTPYPVSHQGRDPDVLVISYHKLWGWGHHLAGQFPTVIFDEVQELRRGKRSRYEEPPKKYVAAEQIAEKARFRLGLSATPIYNYGDEFFSVFEILKPGALGDRSEFLAEWCRYVGNQKHAIEKPAAFGSYLRETGMMLRRTRKQVARELPALQHVVHEFDTTVELKDHGAAADLARTILAQGPAFAKMQAAQEFDMRLRQATGIQKAPLVADFVRMLLENGPVVLFGWHRIVYEIWGERLKDLEPAWYTGTESTTRKVAELDRFLTGKTPLLIMSLRSGSGVDGIQKACSQVVVGELDWSPGVLEQCIGRVHRDGQASPVLAYFLTATDGADPVMVDVLDLKRTQLEGVQEPFGELVMPKEVDPHHVKKLAEEYLRRREGRR